MSGIALIRDVAIILLAIESLVIGLLLILLIIQMRGLAKMLEEEVQPILESARDTATTVRGTTVFINNTLIRPLIRAAGYASAANRVVGVLTGIKRRKGK